VAERKTLVEMRYFISVMVYQQENMPGRVRLGILLVIQLLLKI